MKNQAGDIRDKLYKAAVWMKRLSMQQPFLCFGGVNRDCQKTFIESHTVIAEEKELCDQYMGKFPVVSITMKGAEALRFQFLPEKENLPKGKTTTKGSKIQNPGVCFYHGILVGLLSYREDWDVNYYQIQDRLLEEKVYGADRPVKEQEEIWRQQNGDIRAAAFLGAGFPVEKTQNFKNNG